MSTPDGRHVRLTMLGDLLTETARTRLQSSDGFGTGRYRDQHVQGDRRGTSDRRRYPSASRAECAGIVGGSDWPGRTIAGERNMVDYVVWRGLDRVDGDRADSIGSARVPRVFDQSDVASNSGIRPSGGSYAVAVVSFEEITRHGEPDPDEVVWVGEHPPVTALAVVEPDPSWPAQFDELAARIRLALGDRVLALEHIGSTSVPDLPAKPIIDIDLTVPNPATSRPTCRRSSRPGSR